MVEANDTIRRFVLLPAILFVIGFFLGRGETVLRRYIRRRITRWRDAREAILRGSLAARWPGHLAYAPEEENPPPALPVGTRVRLNGRCCNFSIKHPGKIAVLGKAAFPGDEWTDYHCVIEPGSPTAWPDYVCPSGFEVLK